MFVGKDVLVGVGGGVFVGKDVLVGVAVGSGVLVGIAVGSTALTVLGEGEGVDVASVAVIDWTVAAIAACTIACVLGVGEGVAAVAGSAVAVEGRRACTVALIAACTVACVLGVGAGAAVGLASSRPATPSTTHATRRITTRAPIPHQKYEEQPLPEPPSLLMTEVSGVVLPDPPDAPGLPRSRLSHSTQVQAAGCSLR